MIRLTERVVKSEIRDSRDRVDSKTLRELQ